MWENVNKEEIYYLTGEEFHEKIQSQLDSSKTILPSELMDHNHVTAVVSYNYNGHRYDTIQTMPTDEMKREMLKLYMEKSSLDSIKEMYPDIDFNSIYDKKIKTPQQYLDLFYMELERRKEKRIQIELERAQAELEQMKTVEEKKQDKLNLIQRLKETLEGFKKTKSLDEGESIVGNPGE